MGTKAGKIHEMLAQHHEFAADQHAKAAEKIGKGDAAKEFHSNMAQHHAEMQNAHTSECEACAKADTNQMATSRVSGVAPTVRAVPRVGQKSFGNDVPLEFQKLVSVEDDE